MRIGGKEFADRGRTYIMGILNVTPDSFSDGGKYDRMDRALYRVEEMIGEGMDILDMGGESTRPGHVFVSPQEEAERVIPVLEAVKKRFDIPISLDTYKYRVAEEGIRKGADLINDIWGLRYDQGEMARLLAESGLPCCLMHNRKEAGYVSLMEDIKTDLAESLRIAREAGIREERIILDPGIGFGKTREDNLAVIADLESLHVLGRPLLLGASRKSVIGLTLDLPLEERLEGTLVTTVFGVTAGCSYVRVHDVAANVRAVRMAEAILGRG